MKQDESPPHEEEELDGEIVELDAEVLAGMRNIAQKAKPWDPFFSNIHPYQGSSEVEMVREWAEEMRKLGHTVPIDDIKRNINDPPDVFAVLDGAKIGIEVTLLIEEGEIAVYNERLRFLQRQSPDAMLPFEGGMWTQDMFEHKLRELVKKKDNRLRNFERERAKGESQQSCEFRLHRRILLIFTCELHLQDTAENYLRNIEVPQPACFDDVYVMRDYHTDGYNGHYPIHKVSMPLPA